MWLGARPSAPRSMLSQARLRLLAVAPLLALASCQAMYFTTLEKFGIEKREILLERVTDARDAMVVTEQRLDETFAVYSETIHQESGDLAAMHKRFSDFYDKTEDAADDFHDKIARIQSIAGVMFEEWKLETGEIIDAELRRKSRANYTRAVAHYENLVRSMRAVEAQSDPILTRLRDHVLFMKLNLHPNSLAPLRKNEEEFTKAIEALREQMAMTYEQVDKFLEMMQY